MGTRPPGSDATEALEDGRTILLVDDAETILVMETMILGDHYDILTAVDGADAVTKAAQMQPDLILMDVMMPNINGMEACRALQGRDDTRHIPVIMVTTRSETEIIREALLAGCVDYVTKPIDGVELLAKVRNILGA